MQPMTWQEFKAALLQQKAQILQFQFAEGQWVDASYHITEIKQAPIVSVDCGGVMNSWTEIIIQLWEPAVKDAERAMSVGKALSIIDIVERKLALNPSGIVKIEFGNSKFDTRQMYPDALIPEGENLIVNLTPDFTQCKAIGRGGSCGTKENGAECCAPEQPAKEKVEMVDLVANKQTVCCTPGGGCC